MIVLPVISQTKYQVENDTLICYTKEDNRIIAILIKEGELCNELNIINDSIIDNQLLQIKNYEILNNNMVTLIDTLQAKNKTLIYNNGILSNENDDLTTKLKTWKNGTLFSGGISVLLLLLLLL